MNRGFWDKLKYPIIGLAPMDGVTDAPFRYIACKYGNPDLIVTEFTSVEGICHGATKNLRAFIFDRSERPICAQLFGSTPDAFYNAAFVVCELGFDGIDINMGCPAGNIASKGAGAALIKTPRLAQQIILRTKEAAKDWYEGKKITDTNLPASTIEYVKANKKHRLMRKHLPVSVKTRIGYDKIVIEDWVKTLLETKPANISLHGRTLKQMYTGLANWEEIAKGAAIIKQTKTTVLGNGDTKSIAEAQDKIKTYGVDGILIGRAAFGNPWLFADHQPTIEERFKVALEHAKLYEKLITDGHFFPMRKHLAWYCKGFKDASELRQKLMFTTSAKDVAKILADFKQQN